MNPSFVDLKPDSDFVEDQGVNGACTGYAGSKAMDVFYERAGQPLQFSPMYLWAQERAAAGTPGNVGVDPGRIIQVLKSGGICLQSSMPDDVPFDAVPTAANIVEASNYKITSATHYGMDMNGWDTLTRVKTSLAKGIPILATIYAYNGMFSLTGSWKQMHWNTLAGRDNPVAGLHEVLIIGFDDVTGQLLMQNSWGPNWGDGGYFGMPFSYLADYSLGIVLLMIELTPASVPIVNAGWRPDVTPIQNQVQQAYVAYFGRPADLSGLTYWANVAAASSITTVIDSFAQSDESMALYAGAAVADVITKVYLFLFNRAPDAEGLAYWAGEVNSKRLTIGRAIYSIMIGAQAPDAAIVSAKVEAANFLTFTPHDFTAQRKWLSGIQNEAQVQPAIQVLPC